MPNSESPMAFQGRKAAREGSELRRLSILQAALRVVARDGVRGVKHRAVAAEAGVPLSATTYYFKDIHDLLTDAFTLYAKESVENYIDPFWSRANLWLSAYPEGVREHPEQLAEVLDHLAQLGAEYVFMRLQTLRDNILIDNAFRYAALTDIRMHALALQHDQRLMGNFTRLLEYLGTREVESAARSLMSTIRRMEFEGMLSVPDRFTSEWVSQVISHQLRAMLSV
ncbi:MAG TPA: TetR family transcriptional regulator [Moraxellaceae bacterium]|nr:TetR family transcriptional regulator [Moraxellaceae bacterium]HQX90294.1 TetR family transcriptional regulator [Moraxellaceae bacterium]